MSSSSDALSLIATRIKNSPRDLSLRILYSRALAAAGLKLEAKRAAEEADELYDLTFAEMHDLMRLHRDLGALHRVERLARLVLDKQPARFDFRRELIINYIQCRELPAARVHLEQAMSMSDADVTTLIEISTYYREIITAMSKLSKSRMALMTPKVPDAAHAHRAAQRAVELDPFSLTARLLLVAAQLNLDQPKQASKTLDFILTQLQPVDAKDWLQLACFLQNVGRKTEAIEAVEHAEHAERWSVAVCVGVARLLAEEGFNKKAEKLALTCDLTTLSNLNIANNLYDLFIMLKRDDLALTTVTHALQLDPYNAIMREREGLLSLVHRHGNEKTRPPENETPTPSLWSRLLSKRKMNYPRLTDT